MLATRRYLYILSLVMSFILNGCGDGSQVELKGEDTTGELKQDQEVPGNNSNILPPKDESNLIEYPVTARLPLFEPMGDQTILIVGQDMVALGDISEGNEHYTGGYLADEELDDLPVGLTTYLHIQNNQGLISTFSNQGEMKNARLTVNHQDFSHTTPILSIGYYVSNDYDAIQNGQYDTSLKTLADWIKETQVPTFLRIGYEFNAEWTKHPEDPKGFANTYRYIVSKFEQWGVNNCAYVWQTDGLGTESELLPYYPGDDYVDWMGYSHFKNSGSGLLTLAEKHKKPIMIAEATAIDFDLSKDNDLDGQVAWDNWFSPLFKHIDDTPRIRALAYINDDWKAKAMWENVTFFNKTDSRIQLSPIVKEKWINEISDGTWFKQEEVLQAIGWQ